MISQVAIMQHSFGQGAVSSTSVLYGSLRFVKAEGKKNSPALGEWCALIWMESSTSRQYEASLDFHII